MFLLRNKKIKFSLCTLNLSPGMQMYTKRLKLFLSIACLLARCDWGFMSSLVLVVFVSMIKVIWTVFEYMPQMYIVLSTVKPVLSSHSRKKTKR